jgi:hypothetical protein
VSAYKQRKIKLPDGRVELRTIRPGFRPWAHLRRRLQVGCSALGHVELGSRQIAGKPNYQ